VFRLESVTKRYLVQGLEVLALREASVEFARGEFAAVIGKSGSGKSTLLMLLGGMGRPSSGRVLFAGDNLYALDSGARARLRAEKIGFVFQSFQLIPYLNTLENVLVPALAGRRAGMHRRAGELLERLGVGGRAAHRPAELSAGERQRVALARAMLREPDVLLADEPTGNLDKASAEQVMDSFAEFQQSGGTVIMVTHDEQLAGRASRVVRLTDGRVQESTPPPTNS